MSSLTPLGALANVASTGVGAGAGAALAPAVQDLANEAWRRFPNRPVDPVMLAQGVAEGQIERDWAVSEALNMGVNEGRFNRLIAVFDTGPGVGYAFELWRRGKIGETAFRRALKREAFEEEWIDALVLLKQRLLTPAELAVMIQRTVVPNPGILPNQPSTQGSNVPPMPQVDIDPVEEAAGAGVSRERLAAMARIIGLPASPDLAARMAYRGIITRGAFNQAILEGNTRGEWAPFLFEGFRDILTSHQYAELELRGYIDRPERLAGTRKHGMSDADSDQLFNVLGRSIPVHQIETGQARGGVYGGPIGHIPEPFLAAMRRGNLRPEYYNLAYANRYSYPSGFQIRGAAQAGEITHDETVQVLLEMGWSPKWAAKFAAVWTGGAGAAADPNVKKAQTQLWGATHRSFVNGEIGNADAEGTFDQLAIPAEARPEILGLWMTERDLNRKSLTPTQVKKAYAEAVFNPATGGPWSYDDALSALERLGYSYDSATTFLEL